MLTEQQRKYRATAARKKRIEKICQRLDRHVGIAEKYKTGSTRKAHLLLAEDARKELRKLDH